jgi:hypothetical protein
MYKKYAWHIFYSLVVVTLYKSYSTQPSSQGWRRYVDMAIDRTVTVSTHDRAPRRNPCLVCPQERPGRFYHPQDVITMTLQESGATDTARDTLALALYWFEDVVSQLVRVYIEQASTRTTAQRPTGT